MKRGLMARARTIRASAERPVLYAGGGVISARGKIRPRRQTGTCARHQRRVAEAIKRARHMALLPFAGELSR